jgi:hypothetical protein
MQASGTGGFEVFQNNRALIRRNIVALSQPAGRLS